MGDERMWEHVPLWPYVFSERFIWNFGSFFWIFCKKQRSRINLWVVFMKWVYVLGIILAVGAVVLVLPDTTNPLPYGECHYKKPYLPDNWWVMEAPECVCGTMCRYEGWVPRLTIGGSLMEDRGIWVFGVTPSEEKGGILHFREYPETDCVEHCVGCTPVLYEAEVIYVPYYGDPVHYSPYEVPVTYIPPGRYIVTSPSFHIYNGVEIWYFWDDGNGPLMSAHLETDKPHYGKDESPVFTLTVTDQLTGDPIKVDGIAGEIVLPDQTKKTITTIMWAWNEEEKHYTCQWDLKNDDGSFSDPQEGGYLVQVTARKHLYKDASTSSDFMVCYNVSFEIEFDRVPPLYAPGDNVSITVGATEDGSPFSGTLMGEITPPEGSSKALEWEEISPGVFHTSYMPNWLGKYLMTVWTEDENGNCFLGRASSSFEVIGDGEFACPLSGLETLQLAEMYNPYVYFYKGLFGEEEYFPTGINSMLEKAELWQYSLDEKIGEGSDIEDSTASYDSDYYLDLLPHDSPRSAPHPQVEPSTVAAHVNDRDLYCRVSCFQHEGMKYVVIQYWFFYLYNDGNNNHEGEWEMIEVLLDYDLTPIGAGYSHHYGGAYRQWNSVPKMDGTHPVVYVAKGSHAAYFYEVPYGIQNSLDIVSDDGWKEYLTINEYLLKQKWLDFGGNWGYRCSSSSFSGPLGPKYQGEKWDDPVGWAFSLNPPLVVVINPPYRSFYLSCPADMLITNSAGERLGFVNGEFVQEIPHSYVQDNDEEECYLIQGDDQLIVEIYGIGEGTFDLVLTLNSWNDGRTLRYTGVPVTETTKAVLNLNSDLSLEVDFEQDGIIDLTVFPDSVSLSSPQSIKPLRDEMNFDVIVTNEGPPSNFVMDIDTPVNWSFSASAEAFFLDSGQSSTVLITVTPPPNTPIQDYTIRVEAHSQDDPGMSACMMFTASGKSELVVDELEITQQNEDVVLTASLSNVGLLNAESVLVKFFLGQPDENNLLGEQVVDVLSEEKAFPSITCSLPDGQYVFSAVVDPENSISESCESNNELSIEYLLDRTPPEAEIYFDLQKKDLTVMGVDNLDPSVDTTLEEKVIKGNLMRVYTFKDNVGNSTELSLIIKKGNHSIEAEIAEITYNDQTVPVPKNALHVEYVIKENSSKMLNQFLIIDKTEVHLIYNGEKDETTILGEGKEEGVLLIVIKTVRGGIQYELGGATLD
jgi:hypothetical protein